MDSRDSIKWCDEQIARARDTLMSIGGGSRYFHNGEDITSNVAAKATAIMLAMSGLIAAYLVL